VQRNDLLLPPNSSVLPWNTFHSERANISYATVAGHTHLLTDYTSPSGNAMFVAWSDSDDRVIRQGGATGDKSKSPMTSGGIIPCGSFNNQYWSYQSIDVELSILLESCYSNSKIKMIGIPIEEGNTVFTRWKSRLPATR